MRVGSFAFIINVSIYFRFTIISYPTDISQSIDTNAPLVVPVAFRVTLRGVDGGPFFERVPLDDPCDNLELVLIPFDVGMEKSRGSLEPRQGRPEHFVGGVGVT